MSADGGTDRPAVGRGRAGGGVRNSLSGSVTGPSVQAGTIHDVHVHMAGEGAKALVPHQLPAMGALVGRECERAALDARVAEASGARVLAISGMPGVGKTALA